MHLVDRVFINSFVPFQVISAYLPVIMEKLEFVLENTFKKLVEQGKKLILEQVITTIASVADAAQDQFVTYYSKLMPPLKFILEQASDDRFKVIFNLIRIMQNRISKFGSTLFKSKTCILMWLC